MPDEQRLADVAHGKVCGRPYFKLPSDVLGSKKLTANAKLVFTVLFRHYSIDRDETGPTQEVIAKMCGVSVPAVKRSLNALEKTGLIGIRQPSGRDRMNHLPCRYRFPSHTLLSEDWFVL